MVPLQSLKDLFSSCQGHSLSQACLDGYPKGGTKLYPASLGRRSTRPCALDLWVARLQNLCLPYPSRMPHSAFGDGIADGSSTRTPVQDTGPANSGSSKGRRCRHPPPRSRTPSPHSFRDPVTAYVSADERAVSSPATTATDPDRYREPSVPRSRKHGCPESPRLFTGLR